jgi:diguanylate cyclase (GGDEF)-like protein
LHTPVVTKPFELVEGQIAYVIHRPIKDKDIDGKRHDIDDRYVMLVILAKSLFNTSLAPFQDYGVTLFNKGIAKNPNEEVLFKQALPPCNIVRSLLFPKLTLTVPLESKTQPFILSVERQLGWRAINWSLLGVLFVAGLITFYLLIHYAKFYHLTQISRIQEANHFFYMANHDSLTGLANRNLLMDRLGHALKQAKRTESKLAVLFLDLDNFKQVNDKFGHEIGDKVLIKVAERLRDCIRSGDTLARRSGDEFVIVLENITAQDNAEQVIEKIQSAFAQHFDIEGIDIQISLSIGLASYPDEAADATELLSLADKRMYEKK